MIEPDTIAAISTPIGEGGIGIVRMSGPRSVEIAEKIFQSSSRIHLSRVPSHTLHHGFIIDGGRKIDEVLVSVMRAPRTYTREDIVEINCHGGIAAVRAVLDLLLRNGARLAERGEFTKRAFLNGRISLDQAQAVLDAVRAQTQLGLEAAIERIGGRFTQEIATLRDEIATVLADIEVEIDYPDIDADVEPFLPRIRQLYDRADKLVRQADRGRVVREGLTVAIVGRPNVGKSTLLNTFLAEERAIVTPIPGTTRDTVEEVTEISGIPVRLIDTAGLRSPTDEVEKEGVKRAKRAVERSDLVLLLLDRSTPPSEEDRELLITDWHRPAILVLNKSDLPPAFGNHEIESDRYLGVYEISAKTGDGVNLLAKGIVDSILTGGVPTRGTFLLLDTWERDLLRRTRDALYRAVGAVESRFSPDIVAEELKAAYLEAGKLQGIDISEDVLTKIFSRFCVGK